MHIGKTPARIGLAILLLWFFSYLGELRSGKEGLELYPFSDWPMFESGVPDQVTVIHFEIYKKGSTEPVTALEWQMLHPLDKGRIDVRIATADTSRSVKFYNRLSDPDYEGEDTLRRSIVEMWTRAAQRLAGPSAVVDHVDAIEEKFDVTGSAPRLKHRRVVATLYP